MKLKVQNKALREKIRRLRLKEKQMKIQTKNASEVNEYKTLRELGCKLLPANFVKLLCAEIDTQTKSKRDIRYDLEFKKFALSLYFLSPRNYKELKNHLLCLPYVLYNYSHKRGIFCLVLIIKYLMF